MSEVRVHRSESNIPQLFEQSTVTDGQSQPQPQSEDFLKRVKKWQNTQRGGLQPSHRKATLKAIESGDSLNKNIQKDFLSLENVEQSLHAMKTYVEIGNVDFSTKNDIIENSVNVRDCLKVKNETKIHVKNAQRSLMESQVSATSATLAPAAVKDLPEVEVLPLTSTSTAVHKKSGIIGEGGGGGGETSGDSSGVGLKLARMHNQARLSKLKQIKPQVTALVKVSEDKQDMTFLTGLTLHEEEDYKEECPASVAMSSSRSTAVTIKDISRNKHTAGASLPLSTDDVHTPPEKPRPPPRTQQQQQYQQQQHDISSSNSNIININIHQKLLENPIERPDSTHYQHDSSNPPVQVLSKYHHHGQAAPSISVHDVHALHSSVVQKQHLASRSKSSARRGGGEYYQYDQSKGKGKIKGQDESLLEEEVAERQLMWLMRVEAKNRAAKRDKENRIIEEVSASHHITQYPTD
jgi:hypothetical protein